MALATTNNRISYAGNGVTTGFAFPYRFLENADLTVIVTVDATGVETVKTITTHYTVTGAGEDSGGTVTMLVAPASGETLTILRDPDATQELDLRENDELPAENVEEAFDRLTMLVQRLKDRVDRAVTLTDGFTASFDLELPTDIDTAGASIIVNATEDGFELGPTADEISDAQANATAAAASAAAAAASESAAAASAAAAALSSTQTTGFAEYANDAAYVSANGTAEDGDAYYNTTTDAIKVYANGVWETVPVASGELAALRTLTGTSASATTLGTFTGAIISDNTTIKNALQELETEMESGSSSGTGAKNYISNPIAYADTSGWATYVDAADQYPVDGTGGSANVTWTRSTTTPLSGNADFQFSKDANDRQGQGVSFDFTIDNADLATVMSISFDYEIVSGTYNPGSASVNSDLTVYVYDVTNAQLIQPNVFKISGAVVGQKYKFVSTFQTNSNSTSYRFIIHEAQTGTSAFVVAFDNFILGPQQKALVSAPSDWISFTPTGSWSTNTTYTGFWRRVGDTMEIQAKVATAGAPTSATLTINLPSGYTIDTAKLLELDTNENMVGFGIAQDSATSYYPIFPTYESTTSVRCRYHNGASPTASANVTQAAPFTFGNTDSVSIFIRVPIVGWGSSLPLLGADAVRTVAAKYNTNSSAAFTNNTVVPQTTTEYDTHGALNGSGVFTVPIAGKYKITGCFNTSATAAAATNNFFGLRLLKNGSNSFYIAPHYAVNTSAYQKTNNGSVEVNCVAGDTLEVRLSVSSTNGHTYGNDADLNYIMFERLAGPEAISASETIAVRVGGDPASASSGNPIIFPTVSFDTHGAYNASTGRYTAPVSGIYQVSGFIASANFDVLLSVYVNAASVISVSRTDTDNGEAAFCSLVRVNAGDIIDLRPDATVDATILSNMSITKI